jgi:hypothetical protein
MYLDGNLVFSNPQTITATAASTSIIDLSGLGSGNTMTNIIGNATAWGEDIGVGDVPGTPKLMITLGSTNWATGTSLNVQFQGAPDSSGSPGTYVTYAESGVILTAALLANAVIFKVDVPEVQPEGGPLPRFLRLNYVVAGSNFTNAVIQFAGIVRTRQDWTAKFYPSGFSVA